MKAIVSQPKIAFYGMLSYDKSSGKTPKYVLSKAAGFYPPFNELKGRNGRVSFYLMEKLKEGANVPSMRLQCTKNSMNFTGLKDYFIEKKISGYAYGEPLQEPTFSTKNKVNPFFDYKSDGYLFIVKQGETYSAEEKCNIPIEIEFLIIEGGRVLAPRYLKQLMMGGFDEEIEELRKHAADV
jgi:hypothetical protein